MIQGGEGVLFASGKPVLAIAKLGKGTLVVMTLSNSFVDSKMGNTERAWRRASSTMVATIWTLDPALVLHCVVLQGRLYGEWP